jgi:4-amino-4-deoxy-L-arabinose transferase-like glycosyltransferase
VLVIALCAALLLPALFMDGMFMDGLIYTCVGKNLAAGQGTFWDPFFSATYMSSYHEQPPLMFALEAGFFRVFGESLYTERIYCLFMCIACWLALRMIWRALWPAESAERKIFWLPALLFFISPVTFYAYTNNVEEATMVVFALLAAAFIFRGLRAEKNTVRWFMLGGVALIASSMCKGFQGLFPLVIPLVWWFCVRDIPLRKALIASGIVIAVPLVFYVLISLYEPARNSYAQYFHDRIYATFNVQGAATTHSRFFLLYELLLDLLPALAIGSVLLLISRRQKIAAGKEALAFFLIGMAGILPLMVTLEQRGFYLVTGLPFVTTAVALFCTAGAKKIDLAFQHKRMLRIAVLAAGIVLLAGTSAATVFLAGTPKRDAALLADVKLIGENCGRNTVLSAGESTWTVWSLQGYLVRYYNIALSRSDTTAAFYIVHQEAAPPAGYTKVPLGTQEFHLYAKP